MHWVALWIQSHGCKKYLGERAANLALYTEALRSGKEFSPYGFEVIHPAFPFKASERFSEELQLRDEEEDWGYASEGEEFDEAWAAVMPAFTDGSTGPPVKPMWVDGGSPSSSLPTVVHGEKRAHSEGLGGGPSDPHMKKQKLESHASDKEQRRRVRKRKNRALKRLDSQSPIKSVAAKRVHEGASKPIQTGVNLEELPTTRSRWMGKRFKGRDGRLWTMEELLAAGFRIIHWDGKIPHLIVDGEGTVIVILGGQPRDQRRAAGGPPTYNGWKEEVVDPATQNFRRARSTYAFTEEQLKHRRGDYVAVDEGLSFGGGQTVSLSDSRFLNNKAHLQTDAHVSLGQ